MSASDLRPLGVGEILDRAVTLFVRRFAPLVLILSLVAAPAALLQFIAQPESASLVTDIQRIMTLPPGHASEQRAVLDHITAGSRFGGWTVLLLMFTFVITPLATTACTIGAARGYTGTMPAVRDLFREVLRRWIPQLITTLFFFGMYLAVFLGLFVAVLAITFVIVALSTLSSTAAVIVGVPLGLAGALVLTALTLLVYLAWQLAFVSIALEEPNPVRAVARGMRRAFGRSTLWRSLLVALIVFVVSLMGSLVLGTVAGVLAFVTHVNALYPIVLAIGSVTINGLLVTYLVVYSYDVRIRREGYDLNVSLAQRP
ncbi:MAG: glycerophosphoryl diester phosphodiesterase membrane domain-containing protein [Candidatus Velthaea sp.]